jgi:hypothetical protein
MSFCEDGPEPDRTAYAQCELRKAAPGGHQYQVSWLPVQFAQVGRVLRLRAAGVWDDGWRVVRVYPFRRTGDDLDREDRASVESLRKAVHHRRRR